MNFETLKLRMYAVENSVLFDAEDAYGDGDAILLEALEQLTPLVLDPDQHDALVDVIAAYKRARKHFLYD